MKIFHRHSNTFLVELITSKTNEWNELDPSIRSSSNYHIFRNALLKLIRTVGKKVFEINDPFPANIYLHLT